MYQELVAIKIPVKKSPTDTEYVIDMLVAPSYVVRAFAEFLADREEDESFQLKDVAVPFADCSVIVGDSDKVIAAYKCLKRYDIPLSNFKAFEHILKESSKQPWRLDTNFKLFEKWFAKHRKTDGEAEDEE